VTFEEVSVMIMSEETEVLLYDRSHWGRIEVRGSDRLRFLHNQSTNDFQRLQPGQGCDSVFVTSTARTLDLATAYVTEESVILLVSADRREKLLQWMDRYIFPMDQVELVDITDQTTCLSLIGTDSDRLLEAIGIPPLSDAPPGTHQQVTLGDISIRIAVGSGLATPGYTLILDLEEGQNLTEKLIAQGAKPINNQQWETLRIQNGRPAPDRELTEDYNPLEAGLWNTISFEKGCYIGQETIARLNTYQGVKQQLWGLQLSQPVDPGTPIQVRDQKAGKITSCIPTPEGAIALAYIRTKIGGKGLTVQVADQSATLLDLPFLSRGYLDTLSP
jgi:folate-binding protein YgfZ